MAEGTEVIECGLGAGTVLETLFVAHEARDDREVSRLASAALAAGARVFTLADGVARRVADTVTPHPVFGVFGMTDSALESLEDPSLAVLCAEVRDPGNAGTVLRTCDAAGVDVVMFCGGTVDPFNPKTVRSSAGSIFHVTLAVVPEVARAIDWLRERGVTIYGTDSAGTDYASVDLRAPCAFVLGNEAAGLDNDVRAQLDATVGIPMAGRAESLNVGVSCAVLCFEASRQRRAGR